jgi:hypothetical protein
MTGFEAFVRGMMCGMAIAAFPVYSCASSIGAQELCRDQGGLLVSKRDGKWICEQGERKK